MVVFRKFFVIIVLVAFAATSLPHSAHALGKTAGEDSSALKSDASNHNCDHGKTKADSEKPEAKKTSDFCCSKDCKCTTGGCASVKVSARESQIFSPITAASPAYPVIEETTRSLLSVEILRPPRA